MPANPIQPVIQPVEQRRMSFGAPVSLRLQAERTEEQALLVMRICNLELEAGRLSRELEALPDVNKKALFSGEAFVASGLMLMKRAITERDLL